jgi:tRNA(Ile)-lysidine synthase
MSRGPSLLTIARRALEGEVKLPRGARVVVAVSGGTDSMALLDVLARLAPRFSLELFACGVDHGLRTEAAAELDLAEAHAKDCGIPFARARLTVARGTNLQERARTARWRALAAEARRRRARTIATAHHADDRAETLLMRLLRGAGPRGLAVLPPRAPAPGSSSTSTLSARSLEAIRPLLRARRADTRGHVERHGIRFAEDPSNEDPRFLRVRIRREVLPLLETIDPNVIRHLEALADDLVPRAKRRVPRWTDGLPRPTQKAIATLLETRNPAARILLPGGLVVSLDGGQRRG